MIRRAVALAAFAATACILAGCEPTVTQENYDRITVGMPQYEVEAILGQGQRQDVAGVGISASGLTERSGGPGTRATYLWEENGMQIIVQFDNQKVISKRKSGF